ncbi:MAG: hypothetical protein V4537_16810 [Pseudomonadota bacterium]
MNKFTLMIAGLGIAAATVPTMASAQNYGNWQTINSRQASLDRRIDMGIRNRQLTRNEAVRLRSEFRQIAQLENRYRRGGLSIGERRDLDRRFDALSARIRWERNDRQGRRY